jgi:hypothetical protein
MANNQEGISSDDIDNYAAWLCDRPVNDMFALLYMARLKRPDLQISAMNIRSLIEDQIGNAAELIIESGVWRNEP